MGRGHDFSASRAPGLECGHSSVMVLRPLGNGFGSGSVYILWIFIGAGGRFLEDI